MSLDIWHGSGVGPALYVDDHKSLFKYMDRNQGHCMHGSKFVVFSSPLRDYFLDPRQYFDRTTPSQ